MSLSLVSEAPEHRPDDCKSCVRLREALYFMEADLENAEKALRDERRQVTLLKGQLEKHLDSNDEADEVKELFRIWQGATNHPRSKLMADRKKLIARMLKHYGRDRCLMAIIGLGADAYTNPATGQRYDQIKHAFSDEERFERYEEAGRRSLASQLEAKRRSTTIAQALKAAGMRYVDDEAMQVTYFKCPICRTDDDDPLYYPLGVRYDGKAGYCRECWAEIPDVLRAVGSSIRLFEVAA